MSRSKTMFAPAKVNLCLHVLGKRDDGYHDLAMIMQRVSLYDRLQVRLTSGNHVLVDCPGVELADGETNIVEKAARVLLDHVGLSQGVSVEIEKQIPSAAGLGGGSSDATAVLEALNELLELDLSIGELMSIGVQLGADVPFFLYKDTAWVTGVGERFEPWPGVPPVALVLVNPGISVSTTHIFQNLGLTHQRPVARIPRFPVEASDLVRLLHNDLEVVTRHHHPVITTIKKRLVAGGAMGALMSGSGATVFGVCADRLHAENVAREIRREADWWVEVVNPL